MKIAWKTRKLRPMILLFLICVLSIGICACPREPQSTDEPPTEIVSEVDGAAMILIPSATFQSGSTTGDSDEKPVHPVLHALYMDIYEVTNAHYQKFVESIGYAQPPFAHNPHFMQHGQISCYLLKQSGNTLHAAVWLANDTRTVI